MNIHIYIYIYMQHTHTHSQKLKFLIFSQNSVEGKGEENKCVNSL